jgi:Fe-S-cluster containining protein
VQIAAWQVSKNLTVLRAVPGLAEFYQQYLESPLEAPNDADVDCGHCLMIEPQYQAGRLSRDPGPFLGSLKCCSFQPFIPNFALGALLKKSREANESEGLAFSTRLAAAGARGRLTPLGLIPQEIEAENLRGRFGKDESLRCTFFNSVTNDCSIWQHRPSICASYVCISKSGQAGDQRWDEISDFGSRLEWAIAHDVLWRMGWTQDDIKAERWFEFVDRKYDLFDSTFVKSLELDAKEVAGLLKTS